MNDKQIDRWMTIQAEQLKAMLRIATALESMAAANAPKPPNLTRPIQEFKTFDWASIGVTITAADDHGPTALEWNRRIFTRRSPSNKFGEAIWFSVADGKNADGQVVYQRLITFKAMGEAEPLNRKVTNRIEPQAGKITGPVEPLPAAQSSAT